MFPKVTVGCANTKGSITMGGVTLTLYACGECGFSELFMRPPLVSWKKPPAEYGLEFEWVRPPQDTPFR